MAATIHKHFREDLKILCDLGADYSPGTRFSVIFTTQPDMQGCHAPRYVCEFKDGKYHNCEMSTDGHTVVCLLDNHGLPCGRLWSEVWCFHSDPQMPDRDLRLVSRDLVTVTDEYGNLANVELTTGHSDTPALLHAHGTLLPPIIKGERGEQGEQGLQGEKGERGERGEQGLQGEKGEAFTYADFTPEQLAALNGERGERGPQGERGEKGDKGAAATVDTALSATSPNAVSNAAVTAALDAKADAAHTHSEYAPLNHSHTIPLATEQTAGLMTADMVRTLHGLEQTGGGTAALPLSAEDLDEICQ